jgi:hypothetical protein
VKERGKKKTGKKNRILLYRSSALFPMRKEQNESLGSVGESSSDSDSKNDNDNDSDSDGVCDIYSGKYLAINRDWSEHDNDSDSDNYDVINVHSGK